MQLFHQFGRVQVVDGKPLVHCCLDGVGDSPQLAPELVFKTGKPGVEERQVEHDLVQYGSADFIEPSLECQHTLAEVLDHFKEPAGVLLDLKQLLLQVFNLSPVKYPQSGSRNCHTQCDTSKHFLMGSDQNHVIQFKQAGKQKRMVGCFLEFSAK